MGNKQQYCLDFYVNKVQFGREFPTRDAVANAVKQALRNGYSIERKHWASGKRAIEITDDGTVQRYYLIPSN